jgi:hypothetical protein
MALTMHTVQCTMGACDRDAGELGIRIVKPKLFRGEDFFHDSSSLKNNPLYRKGFGIKEN